jgi:tetratricopeptide (TPR) repeat protein
MAETQLALANKEADQGRYEEGLELLEEARRLAVGADSSALRIRTDLSRGNMLFYLGRTDEARQLWEAALAESRAAGEETLAAVSRVYLARDRLAGGADPEAVLAELRGEMGALKSDRSYTALGWTVIGLAEKESGRWAEAEASLRNALEIHEKDHYLELAAYDWYLIASVRSVAGRYDEAQEALGRALAFDRRAENTYGLGMDWMAIGDVHVKAGRPEDAEAAYRRSADIFASEDLHREAAEALRRIPVR